MLRDSRDSSRKTASSGSSVLSGLPTYWEVPEYPPKTESEKWFDLIDMAVNAKYYISDPEFTRTPTEQQPQQESLLNILNEQAVIREILRILFL